MPGPAASIALTATEAHKLSTWVRAGTTPQRLVRRARVILGSAAGLGSRALARQEQMSRTTVRRWLARFVTSRCDGLKDRPRRGRPLAIRPTTRALVVALACERPADRNVPLSRYSLSELTLKSPIDSTPMTTCLRAAPSAYRHRAHAHACELAQSD